jgi:ankyrin repeat protein
MLLCDQMSSVNCQDSQDDTPLHWAVIMDNSMILKFLLNHRAKKFIKNYHQNTPVMIACINQRLEMLRLLLEPNQTDSEEFRLSLAQQ